jgi:hypothetical protein
MMQQYSGSPPRISGITLQKALGYKPLSMSLIALWISSFCEETPLLMYFDSSDILPALKLKYQI